MLKILHAADIHADNKNPEELAAILYTIVDTAKEEKVDVAILAGDVFDSREILLDSQAVKLVFDFVFSLSFHCPVAILTGTPSHEGHATDTLKYAYNVYKVVVSSKPEQLFLETGELLNLEDDLMDGKPEAIISMMPTPTKQFLQGNNEEITAAITPIFMGFGTIASQYDAPHILVYHGTFAGASISDDQVLIGRDIEISKQQIELAKIDLGCFGHIHYPQEIRIDDKVSVFYSGSTQARNYGEAYDHGFYLHYFNQDMSRMSEFIKLPGRRLFSHKANFVKDPNAGLVPFDLSQVEGTEVKVDITLYQDDKIPIDLDVVRAEYLTAGAKDVKVNIVRIPRENVRSVVIQKLVSLYDKIAENARVKDETVPDGVEDIARDLESLTEDEIYEKVKANKYGQEVNHANN